MTTQAPSARLAPRGPVDLLVASLLVAQAIRLVAAVVGGIATAAQNVDFAPAPFRNGVIVAQFGDAGDGVGILLLLLATALLCWQVSAAGRAATGWLLVLTAVSAVLAAIGFGIESSAGDFHDWQRLVSVEGFQLAYLVATLGALAVVRRLSPAAAPAERDDEASAAVFAVDRRTGAVLAWPSVRDAEARAPLYGVEDDEYDWFLDDGVVLVATADGRDVRLSPTGDERPDVLLRHLKDYAERRGLTIDEDDDEDEPLAYVDPITRDHYLDMWPGWLRWLGRLTR
ncbi:MAG TPA: hypothetical protein VFJ98_10650 [Mycobacteriales bacterium]|nr:hypothetical protein [Mycobacteriales bacterium]